MMWLAAWSWSSKQKELAWGEITTGQSDVRTWRVGAKDASTTLCAACQMDMLAAIRCLSLDAAIKLVHTLSEVKPRMTCQNKMTYMVSESSTP